MFDFNTFKDNLDKIIETRGLQQQKIEEILKVSPTALNNLLSEKNSNPSLRTMLIIADNLNTNLSDLVYNHHTNSSSKLINSSLIIEIANHSKLLVKFLGKNISFKEFIEMIKYLYQEFSVKYNVVNKKVIWDYVTDKFINKAKLIN